MTTRWLIRHYRHLPRGARRILIDERLARNLAVLKHARERYPKVYAIASTMEDLLIKAHRSREALHIWRQTVRRFPRAPNPFFSRAHWAMRRRHYKEAEKYLRLCLARDRGYFRETAHFWRAEALFRLARYDAAGRELANVSDDHEEPYFFGRGSRSKADILRDIEAAQK